MHLIHKENLADLITEMRWQSGEADHTERCFTQVNFWRDILPPSLSGDLPGSGPGDVFETTFAPGEAAPARRADAEKRIKPGQFNTATTTPRHGRFYPRGLLSGLYNIYAVNSQPFRVAGIGEDFLVADLNHPLADKPITMSTTVHAVHPKSFDRGGECQVLMDRLTEGPGMQAPLNGRPTDFSEEGAFLRTDPSPDAEFYAKPRFINHIDDQAIAEIGRLYGSLIRPGMAVLDLMSGWRSHIPESAAPGRVTGLGMNAEEMADNPQLTDSLAHDLNENPALPFDDATFDVVICTVSLEYLTDPVAVFREVGRTLKPGGHFAVTFSNRWFPPKAIRLWTELHEFERMGLALDFFRRAGGFDNLNTLSARGWPRPVDDKYFSRMRYSDPVYGVWGRRI